MAFCLDKDAKVVKGIILMFFNIKNANMVFRLFICFYFCISSSATILFQVAQSVFEAGLKRFMHEPGYILE
jgi:hypothetical protein